MKIPLTDDEFWDLTDKYESKKITEEQALDVILSHTNNYEVATADFTLLVKRGLTKEEKIKIKEKLNAKNIKRGSKPNKSKN